MMHLFELCEPNSRRTGASVPQWVLGCFRRRSITFYTGLEDVSTEVIWLQSRGLTADYRRTPPARRAASPAALGELPLSDLLALARVEGGFARTRWDGELMHWSGWSAFQTHAKWPEPGRLTRVGGCMVELAPSGAYVEDWRYQPARGGPLIGLELLDERELGSGVVRHLGGGLIICGEHAGFVRGRPEPLPEGERLDDFVRAHAGDASALARVFSFDAAYGTASNSRGEFTVSFATLPWREGEPLLSLEGFSPPREGVISQRVEEAGRLIERRFRVDTLEAEFESALGTAVAPATTEWFERELGAEPATRR